MTLGYEVTNCSLTLRKLFAEMKQRRQEILPGESQHILDVLSDVQLYLNQSSLTLDLLQSAQSFFDAIDFVLGHEHSMINDRVSDHFRYCKFPFRPLPAVFSSGRNPRTFTAFRISSGRRGGKKKKKKNRCRFCPSLSAVCPDLSRFQQVKTLQELVVRESAMWGSLHSAPHRVSVAKSSVYVELVTLESNKVYKNAFPLRNKSLPTWMTDRVTVYADATTVPFGNDTFTVIFVSYKNLSQFLPVRYSSRLG